MATGKKKVSKASASDQLNQRQRKYVQGRGDGKSKQQAALDAGYSAESAANAKQVIERGKAVSAALGELGKLLRERIPLDKPVRVLDEGMDATQTLVLTSTVGSKLKGTEHVEVTEKVLPDYAERRQSAALYAKLTGQSVERHEVSMRGELEERSDAELHFFDQHGCWPEQVPQKSA